MNFRLIAILVLVALSAGLFSQAQAGPPIAQAATETPTATITVTPVPMPTMYWDPAVNYDEWAIAATLMCLGVLLLIIFGSWLLFTGLDKWRGK